jgi:hypothetical protein
MKIVNDKTQINEVKLGNIAEGEAFNYMGKYYIKRRFPGTEYSGCIKIDDGHSCMFANFTKVIPVKGSFHIESEG